MSKKKLYQLIFAGLFILTIPAITLAQVYTDAISYYQDYQTRCDSVVDRMADADGYSLGTISAKFYTGRDLDAAWAHLDTLMMEPSGDMFWMLPTTAICFLAEKSGTAEQKEMLREKWMTYTPYRGDTENHWLMYHVSMYLMTQLYPDDPAESWFNGRSSAENHEDAREYLLSWMELTTTIGQGEFDSPHYVKVYFAPMALLYGFSADPEMRLRAQMMLDLLLADFAAESLNGLYIGGHSRSYPPEILNQWNTNSTGLAWLFWNNIPLRNSGMIEFVAMSGYRPPEILYNVATDRSKSYIHREYKRTRHRMRFSNVRNAPVYKYNYICRDYAMGSLQGGLLQPIQQHTWDVTWTTEHPKDGYNQLFCLHPSSSAKELAMYFPEELKLLTRGVSSAKTSYDLPTKWHGASDYEQVFQSQDALIVLFDIPKNGRFPFISGFFPKSLTRRDVDKSGWIFCQGGDTYIAYYPLADYNWREEDKIWRLHSTKLKNGAVIQAASSHEYVSFDAFKMAVKALPLVTKTQPSPKVEFTSLRNEQLVFAYDEIPRINGVSVDYEGWPLYEGPFINAAKNSKKIVLSYGTMRRVLDFNTLTIQDFVVRTK